jgi:acetyl-CoA C-acetyltransferase
VIDGRTPVIVGVGQVTWREGDAPEPVDLLAEATRAAIADTGARRVPGSIVSTRLVRMFSARYRDPGSLLATRIGASPGHTAYTGIGGHWPQTLVGRAADEIADGLDGVVLIGGAETWRTRLRYRSRGLRMPSTPQLGAAESGSVPAEDASLDLMSETEMQAGVVAPVHAYALIESALRAKLGRHPGEHARSIAQLWAGLSAAAATNSHAAVREPVTAARIGAADDSNRLISTPYTKLLTANNRVDQSAAVLLCSVATARRLRVPGDRWIFLHGASESSEVAYLSHRGDLASAPSIGDGARAALRAAGVGIDDIAHLDVYSCFPSAVQVAARELGIDLRRTLTVTGGLTFAGGPWNNYVSHALATMVAVLREDPGSYGLCTANGGVLTKHAFGIYSSVPPATHERVVRPAPRPPLVEADPAFVGKAHIEAATVAFERCGPDYAVVCARTPDGRRTWARTADRDIVATMIDTDTAGARADFAAGALRAIG